MARAKRRPASTMSGFTRTVKRDILKGGEGRVRRKRRPPDLGPLFARLRRVELAVCAAVGKGDLDLDAFVIQVLTLRSDAQTQSSRRDDQRGTILVPQEGAPPGEAERAYRADSGPPGRVREDEIPYEGAPPAEEEA